MTAHSGAIEGGEPAALDALLAESGFDVLFDGLARPAVVLDSSGLVTRANGVWPTPSGYTPVVGEPLAVDLAGAGTTRIPLGDGARPVGEILILGDSPAGPLPEDRRSLAEFANLIAHVGGWSYDVATATQTWADEIYPILGREVGSVPSIAESLQNYTDGGVAVRAALSSAIEHGTPIDLTATLRTIVGETKHVRILGRPQRGADGRVISVRGAFSDITDQVEAARARTELEEQLAHTYETISDGMLLLAGDWTVRHANARARDVLGQPGRLEGRSLWDVFPAANGSEFGIALREAMARRVATVARDVAADLGRWLESSAFPTADGLAVYVRDVSAEERARTDAIESQRQLSSQAALLDIARDAIIVRDLSHRVSFWNRAAERIYGWTAEEVLGRSVRELLFADPTEFDRASATVVRDGYWAGEIVKRRRDGTEIIVDARWQLVTGEDGTPESIFDVNSDVTDRKREQELSRRAQRMESLGTLAGGIAHDLNNVLTPILLAVRLLQDDIADTSRRQLLTTMETGIKRGAEMIRQVLAFARGVEGERVAVDVGQVLTELRDYCRESFGSSVEVDFRVPPGLPPVLGDSTQLLQVLLNLATNARDAMPGGGTLGIRAEVVEWAGPLVTGSVSAPPGQYVVIIVHDSGIGITPEVLDRIFEPFFTTKAVGEGTGLGLATSAAIVRSHGGVLQAFSEPGRGTRIVLHLPAMEVPVDVAADGDPDAAEPVPEGRGELVLIVDDEPAIRQVTRAALEAHGYLTAVASNGAEAVAYVADAERAVDLVLTDMMMPVMDGPAAVRLLRQTHPAIRILAASGLYSSADGADLGTPATHFLHKPYTTQQLLRAVREVLDDQG